MEMIDILDEFGEKTYSSTSRNEAHLAGHWHATVGLLAWLKHNDTKYILVAKRSSKKTTFPGFYDLTASGHLSKDESVEEGMREFEEELGIKNNEYKFSKLGRYKIENDLKLGEVTLYNKEFVTIYTTQFENTSSLLLDKEEVEKIILIKVTDVPNLLKGLSTESYELTSPQVFSHFVTLNEFVPSNNNIFSKIFDDLINEIQNNS